MSHSRSKTNTPAPGLSRETRPLAWSGWRLRVPANWRPVKLEGTFTKGAMFIGDDVSPYLMLRWWRPLLEGQKQFDFAAWLDYRFKKLHALPQKNPPAPPGVDQSAWVKDLETKNNKSRTVWYGYKASAETVIEILMTSLTPSDIRKRIIEDVMPTLEIASKEDPITWDLFSTRFQSPPGFLLDTHHLYSGDVALRLVKGRETLILRTVYPAGLALSRRKLPNWLDSSPFLERRKNRNTTLEDWSSGKIKGIQRRGWKRLPFPLGRVKPNYSTVIAAVDEERDRLLIAEHRTSGPDAPFLTQEALAHMNRDSDT
ncbi:MAG: hypothetical protein JJU05_02825 [Verrucomicrobia bacterium]|nr:hypothetical protein [Verrucomicrobiota bacterium]MCH8527678.1 hypothetical protein [Kiritimatiellia bacterium]